MHIGVAVDMAQSPSSSAAQKTGEEVVLTRHGQPAVRLVPAAAKPTRDEKAAALAALRKRAARKAKSGPCAARSQDYLYDEYGFAAVIAVDTSPLLAILLVIRSPTIARPR